MIRALILFSVIATAVFATVCRGQTRAAAVARHVKAGGGMHADLRMFVVRRTQCDHFRNEESYNATRAADRDRQLDASCKGTDAALARLKRAYHRDRGAMQALAAYDPHIE